MTEPRSLRILMVTPLDYDKFVNNQERHRVRYYLDRGHRTTVVYKTLNKSRRFVDLILDTITFRIRSRDENGVRLVAVDPPFNYFAGLREDAESRATSGNGRPSWRVRGVRLLSALSVLRDVFQFPALVIAALLKTRGSFDVCLGFGPWGGVAAWLLYRLGRAHTFVYVDRDYEAGLVPDRLRQRYTAALEGFGIRRAHLTLSIGHLLCELRHRQLGIHPAPAPCGVDWARYAAARDAPRNGNKLVYVGNVISWSGVEVAIQALPRIRTACPDAVLRIVGGGLPGYIAHLETLVERLGLAEAVDICGPRPPEALPTILGAATIGLANAEPVPYRRFATPLKILEYMAAGLPVITTEDTEGGDIIERYGCGLAVPYDVQHFADAAIRILSDNALSQRQRDRGIEGARDYDWDRLLEREMALISDARSLRSAEGRERGTKRKGEA